MVLSEPFYCSAAMMILWHRCRRWLAGLAGANPVLQDYASGSRPLIDAALTAQGVKATIVQEIGHPATLFPMVEAGIGISVLPALALPLPQGSRLTVKRFVPCVERQLMLVRRKTGLFPARRMPAGMWCVCRPNV